MNINNYFSILTKELIKQCTPQFISYAFYWQFNLYKMYTQQNNATKLLNDILSSKTKILVLFHTNIIKQHLHISNIPHPETPDIFHTAYARIHACNNQSYLFYILFIYYFKSPYEYLYLTNQIFAECYSDINTRNLLRLHYI